MTSVNDQRAVDNDRTQVDDVMKHFRISGRYHLQLYWWLVLAIFTNAAHNFSFIFITERVDYSCSDEGFENDTCSAFNGSQTCAKWTYENPDSFVGEFQLACQEWKRTLVGTIHSFGYMIGLLLVGPMSDRLGRKKVIVLTGFLGGVSGLLRSFTNMYWVYIALEFLEMAVGYSCSPLFTFTIEMVSSERRVTFQQLSNYGDILGCIILPLAAYLFPYWRTLLRVLYTPALIYAFYYYILDESPRWLLSKGRKDEAVEILQKIAKKNDVKLDKAVLEKLAYEEQKGVNFFVLIKNTLSSAALIKRFIICLIWWTTSTFVNYGLAINAISLQGNKYINYALINIVDIPGTLTIIYCLNRFKRKMPMVFAFTFAAILCFCQPFVPKDLPWLSILLYMSGKFMSSIYFNITYIYTSELFPTYTRNSMHALCSSLGRVGSIIAPQTPLLMHYWAGLPAITFGGASLIAGMVTFLVPDTANEALPDNIKQAEALGLGKKDAESRESQTIPAIVLSYE